MKPILSLGILGLGKLSQALVHGIQRSSQSIAGLGALSATTRSLESAARAQDALGIPCHTDNAQLLRESDIVLLSVKPYQVDEVLESLTSWVQSHHLIVSVIAGVTIERLQSKLQKSVPVVRAMPNTPALVRAGATGLAASQEVSPAQRDLVERLFSAVGVTAWVPEDQLDAVTGLSGSGPAYVFAIIRDLARGGERAGLPADLALRLATETVRGAALLLQESELDPESLIRQVATPGGCTVEGLRVLEEGAVGSALQEAVLASAQRSRALRT